MSEISLRIKQIVANAGLSDRAFAQSIDVAQTTFTNILLKGTEPKSDVLRAIISKYKVNAHWLLTGEGNMFVDEPGTAVAEPVAKIPLLRQSVSCGPGEEWQDADSVDCYIEPMHLLPSLKDRAVYAFRARGTSMVGAGIDVLIHMLCKLVDAVDADDAFEARGDILDILVLVGAHILHIAWHIERT